MSAEKMDKILLHDETNGVLIVQAGCILETAENYLWERGFVIPLNLGAKES